MKYKKGGRIMNKRKEKLFLFLEKNFIRLLLFLLLLTLVGNKLLLMKFPNYGWKYLDSFFLEVLRPTLQSKDSTLITIAAIFIGIYFTVFTLLSSIKIDSTFSILTKKNFEQLLVYIRNAFIGSFLYLFFSLFSSVIINEWFWTVIGLIFLLYMLFSALRFGIIIYLIFSRDVKAFYVQLELERNEKRKQKNLFNRLERFLDQHEKQAHEKYSEDFSKKLEDKIKKDE